MYVKESLLPAVSQSFVLAAAAAAMLVLDWRLGILALVAIPAVTLGATRLGPLSTRLDRELLRRLERGQVFLQEVLVGIRVVRVFDATAREQRRWLQWIKSVWQVKAKTVVLHDLVIAHIGPAAQVLVTAAVFGFGAVLIAGGHLSVGGLIATVALVPRTYASMQRLLTLQGNRARVEAEHELLDAVLSLTPERVGGGTPQLPAADSGSRVEFREATFRYAREDAGVFGVSFSVQPGEFLGIVGKPAAASRRCWTCWSASMRRIQDRCLSTGSTRVRSTFRGCAGRSDSSPRSRNCGTPPSPITSAIQPGRPVTKNWSRRFGTPSSTSSLPDFLEGSQPTLASMGTVFRRASGSGSPSPGRCCDIRACSFWTKPRPPWTWSPSEICDARSHRRALVER